jgi:trehalose 6-phosphate phosphatase
MTGISIPVARAALFLDLDGTLAPIADWPDDVQPHETRTSILRWAEGALSGRLAILSGRTVSEVDRIVDKAVTCVAGVHGLQRRDPAGRMEAAPRHPALGDVREVFEVLARARRGLLVEDKGTSVALHYRKAPEAAEAVADTARRLAEATGLVFQAGDMVAELRSPGPDKGDALAAFMGELPFQGSAPIFIGDDITDERGFFVARSGGGIGILVGDARSTAAAARLETPSDVLAWIACSLDAGVFELRTVQ